MTDIGMSYKSNEAGKVMAPFLDCPPAFRRLFKDPGSGMPSTRSSDMKLTPDITVPWWSHKDYPDLDQLPRVAAVWTELARRFPGKKIRWTFQHEANDLPMPAHARGWRELAALRLDHEFRDQIELTTIIGGYYARFKSMGRWREYVLPEYVQGVAFDLYAPTDRPSYEDPASILGIVDQAKAEYGPGTEGMAVGVAEFGSPRIGSDLGTVRAQWFGDCITHAVRNGYATFGLWNSHEVRDGVKYDYRAEDLYSRTSWQGAFKRHGAKKPNTTAEADSWNRSS